MLPNQFLINVMPEQVDDARAELAKGVGADVVFRPMVRGRLVAVNNAVFDASGFADVQTRRLAEREFNLSWSDTLPKGNKVAKGEFWKPGATGADVGMSLEEGIAESLKVKGGRCPDVSTLRVSRFRPKSPAFARSTGTVSA